MMHHVPFSPITFIATCPPLTATLRIRLPLLGAKGSGIALGHFVIFTRLNSLAALHMVNRLQHLTPPDHHQLTQVGHNRQLNTSWSQSPVSTSWSQSPVKHKLVTISRQL